MKTKLTRLLKINDDDYHSILFKTACDYVEDLNDDEPKLVKLLLYHPIFWRWWEAQYRLIDELFYNTYASSGSKSGSWLNRLRERYVYIHTYIEHTPDDAIIQEINKSFTKMTEDLDGTYGYTKKRDKKAQA